MSYKYSKGAQVIGDLKAADDAQRDTLIDFGEDQIEFQTSGSTRMKVHNSGVDLTGSLHISSSSEAELLRLAKTDADSREIVFEMNGSDRFSMTVNSFENLGLISYNTNDDMYFRLNGHNALYLQGYPKEVRIWDTFNSAYDTVVNSDLRVSGTTQFDSAISFEDTIMAELSIPDVDLQIDTNAFTFNVPYALTFDKVDLYLDQESSSGNVTVTVKNVTADPPETIFEPSISSGVKSGSDTTATNASVSSGTRIRIAITGAGTTAQGLRANLTFKRDLS
jgi:hypothetical protein